MDIKVESVFMTQIIKSLSFQKPNKEYEKKFEFLEAKRGIRRKGLVQKTLNFDFLNNFRH